MELYLLRHGLAADLGGAIRSDFDRPLTVDGRDKMAQASRGLRRLGLRFTHIWSSPRLRARETAELAVPGGRVEIHEVLDNGEFDDLVAELLLLPAAARVLLVGHDPQCSETAGELLGATRGVILMKKASLAGFAWDPQRWPRQPAELLFFLKPSQLRILGGGD